MTSPYLDTPTRSLEQLRDELRVSIAHAVYEGRCGAWDGRKLRDHLARLRARLAAVEAEIAVRDHRKAQGKP